MTPRTRAAVAAALSLTLAVIGIAAAQDSARGRATIDGEEAAFAPAVGRPVFSRDGREVLVLRRDMSAPGRPWRLFAIDVTSGTPRVVMTADFPPSVDSVSGLSLSPDGTRLYTSMSERAFDIWMLEGFR